VSQCRSGEDGQKDETRVETHGDGCNQMVVCVCVESIEPLALGLLYDRFDQISPESSGDLHLIQERTPEYRWRTLMVVRTDFEKILGFCLM
jgi:hypothetical protein